MAITNRRRAKRHNVRVLTALEPGHMQTVAEDVSAGGMFLRSSRVQPPGLKVDLLLTLPAGQVRGHGIVRWARRVPLSLRTHVRGGMGIQITGMSEELRAFVESSAR